MIYEGNLILVNADLPLKETKKLEFASINERFPDILLKREATNILKLIFNKIDSNNDILPVSGYRSEYEQKEIYASSLQDNGADFTKKFVALPNHSEHQTGLAIDLGLKKDKIDFICPDFPYEGVCETFRRMAPYYGYIERYQPQKEDITGIAHEPWHFRYVGYPHSQIIAENNFSLEEYIEFIKQFTLGNSLRIWDGRKTTEIFYVPYKEGSTSFISVPEKCVYQVSGNNKDGFIVTLWRNKV